MDYRLSEGSRADRLKEIPGDPSLDGEVRLLRLIAEEAAQVPGSPLAVNCAAAIGRLIERQQLADVARGALLPRAAVFAVGRAMAQAVLNRCGDLPGFSQVGPLLLEDFKRIIGAERLVLDAQRKALPDQTRGDQ